MFFKLKNKLKKTDNFSKVLKKSYFSFFFVPKRFQKRKKKHNILVRF